MSSISDSLVKRMASVHLGLKFNAQLCLCFIFRFYFCTFLWFQDSFSCSLLFMPYFVSHVFQCIVREVDLKTFRRGTSIARAWMFVGWYSNHYRAAVWSWDEVRLTPRYQRSMPAACHDPVWDEFSMAVHVNNKTLVRFVSASLLYFFPSRKEH